MACLDIRDHPLESWAVEVGPRPATGLFISNLLIGVIPQRPLIRSRFQHLKALRTTYKINEYCLI
jgi:hypothetical protein